MASTTPATTARGRMFGTIHPRAFFWVAGAEVVLFAALGGVLMSRSVGAGIAIIAIGLVSALLAAGPAIWSQRHPDEAQAAVTWHRQRQRKMARQHPTYFLVVVPVFIAADAAVRWNLTQHHHHSALSWAIPAVCGLLVGIAAGTYVVIHARRSSAR